MVYIVCILDYCFGFYEHTWRKLPKFASRLEQPIQGGKKFGGDNSLYQPVDYPDWTVPYTRSFKIENTTVIYNGLPVGKYNRPIVEAYVQAIDSVLSKSMTPTQQVAEAK